MKNICDWNNCNETGEYKAPVEKDNSKKYRLLCLNHIKIFNKNWNYFENMNDQEIEFFIKSDLTWHKSTKTFGSSENFFKARGWVDGVRVDISENEDEYFKLLKHKRVKNKRLGYGNDEINWELKRYENERRNLKKMERLEKLYGTKRFVR